MLETEVVHALREYVAALEHALEKHSTLICLNPNDSMAAINSRSAVYQLQGKHMDKLKSFSPMVKAYLEKT